MYRNSKREAYPTDAEFLEAFSTAREVEYPTNPRAVIEVLKGHGYREHSIRSQMWALIDRGLVIMNNQWRLEDPSTPVPYT